MSDNPVSLFVGNYESAKDAKAVLQKGTEGISALFALTSCGSPVLGIICPLKSNAFDAALSKPGRAEYS